MDEPRMRLLVDAVLAIGVGLFIGLEREHSDVSSRRDAKGEPLPESPLGVRTFALLALFGWVSAFLRDGHPWLPVAALVVAGALVTITAVRGPEVGRGLTTEVAALTTLVLGMLVHSQRALAVALAHGTTLLLISKPWFRTFVPRILRVDLTSTLQLLILLAIVLPFLPDRTVDPWHAISPRRLGIFVALIAAIEYLGYLCTACLAPAAVQVSLALWEVWSVPLRLWSPWLVRHAARTRWCSQGSLQFCFQAR